MYTVLINMYLNAFRAGDSVSIYLFYSAPDFLFIAYTMYIWLTCSVSVSVHKFRVFRVWCWFWVMFVRSASFIQTFCGMSCFICTRSSELLFCKLGLQNFQGFIVKSFSDTCMSLRKCRFIWFLCFNQLYKICLILNLRGFVFPETCSSITYTRFIVTMTF